MATSYYCFRHFIFNLWRLFSAVLPHEPATTSANRSSPSRSTEGQTKVNGGGKARTCLAFGHEYPHVGKCPALKSKCRKCNQQGYFAKSWLCCKIRVNQIERLLTTAGEEAEAEDWRTWSGATPKLRRMRLKSSGGWEKLHLYLFGRSFSLVTDNEAVEFIFRNPKNASRDGFSGCRGTHATSSTSPAPKTSRTTCRNSQRVARNKREWRGRRLGSLLPLRRRSYADDGPREPIRSTVMFAILRHYGIPRSSVRREWWKPTVSNGNVLADDRTCCKA